MLTKQQIQLLLKKRSVFPSECVSNTHRLKVAEYLKEPESDKESFVLYHEIYDSDPPKKPRFTINFEKIWIRGKGTGFSRQVKLDGITIICYR